MSITSNVDQIIMVGACHSSCSLLSNNTYNANCRIPCLSSIFGGECSRNKIHESQSIARGIWCKRNGTKIRVQLKTEISLAFRNWSADNSHIEHEQKKKQFKWTNCCCAGPNQIKNTFRKNPMQTTQQKHPNAIANTDTKKVTNIPLYLLLFVDSLRNWDRRRHRHKYIYLWVINHTAAKYIRVSECQWLPYHRWSLEEWIVAGIRAPATTHQPSLCAVCLCRVATHWRCRRHDNV